MKKNRKLTQIHTRKLDRLVARKQLKRDGFTRTCSKSRAGESWFSTVWKKYAEFDGKKFA